MSAVQRAAARRGGVWNSSFVRIVLYALLCQMTMSITNTVLPLYVINGLGRSATESGLLGTLFTMGSLCCRTVSGYLCNRYGRRACLIAGGLIAGVSLLLLGFETSLLLLLITKMVQGIGHAIDSTASNAAAAEVLPPESVGKGLGYYNLHSTVTNAVGPTICLALMGLGTASAGSSYRIPLIAGGAMGLIAAGIGWSMRYEGKRKQLTESFRLRIGDLLEVRALLPACMVLFVAFTAGAGTYMIVFATDRGFSAIGLYYIINALISVAVRVLLGNRLDQIRPWKIAVTAALLNITAYILIGVTLSQWAFLLSAALLGIYNAMLMPMLNAMAMKRVPAGRTGSASSTYWLGFDVGMATGMVAFGALIDTAGFRGAFLAAAGVMAAFGITAGILLKRFPPVQEMQCPDDCGEEV